MANASASAYRTASRTGFKGISDTRAMFAANTNGHNMASPRLRGVWALSSTPICCASGLRNTSLNWGNSGLPKRCHSVSHQ